MDLTAALWRARGPGGQSPSWGDALWVILLAVPSAWSAHQGAGLGAVARALAVVVTLPVLWRRRAPVGAFGAAWAVAAVQGLLARPTFSDSALLIVLYTIAVQEPRRAALAAWATLEASSLVASIEFSTRGLHGVATSFVAMSAMSIAALVIGINVGHRRQILAGLRERAARLEAEREQEVALARAAERSRIAREMHDVIAHNLSVMVALCDGAAFQVNDDPRRAATALEQASRTGRQALAEMRQLLGVLRDAPPGEAPPAQERAPQPGLREIEDLVEHVRAAGLPVTLSISGDLSGAAPATELAVFRIIQEALTNTLKHGGAGARASVTLRRRGDRVEIHVRDTGSGGRAPRGRGSGLRGMRERAAVFGGVLEAGPHPEGGWEVRATLESPTALAAAARP